MEPHLSTYPLMPLEKFFAWFRVDRTEGDRREESTRLSGTVECSRFPYTLGGWPRRQLVGEAGLEPAHPFEYWHLKPARLPFRHSPEWKSTR
jgi:hypothetical protein